MAVFEEIKSFVRREGRITTAQKQAFSALYSKYGVSLEYALDLDHIFQRTSPKILEIGFGDGTSLIEMAICYPEQDFMGVEVYRAGVGRSLLALEQKAIRNVRVVYAEAQAVLEKLSDQVLERVQVFFSDPWPKRRHHKRRLIQVAFLAEVAEKLKLGGQLHLATDWAPYAKQMSDLIDRSPQFKNLAEPNQFSPRPAYRPITKFEKRGFALGHRSFDLRAIRI